MSALIAPTAPEAVTSLLFDQLVDSGWICLEAHGLKHWAEKSGLLCGAKVPPEVFTVLDRGPLVYNSQFSACQKCVSKLVHREFALPFRVGQRVISRACGMVLRGKIVRFFLFDDSTPALDITREWARPPEEISVRRTHLHGDWWDTQVFDNDIYPHDWYRAAHECKPLEEKPMTQTTTKKASAAAKNLPVKAKQDSSKKVKVPAVTPAPAETSAPTFVESATCPETGATYSVGDWVSYSIKGAAMAGQILTLEIQAPPFQPVASVPNKKTGLAWTLELRELQPAQAPEADSPFPVTEADIDAAIIGTPTPELTPVNVVAVPVIMLAEPLTPGTLGLHSVPLPQLVRSGCNVRRHYDPAAIEELAASLKAEGQIENATGRWDAQGRIEIVAGESRRRAQVLREEAGEVGLTLLVNVRELTDGEALAISATENMRRRSMTPLEECEAMNRLNETGRSVEDLQVMFGYKTAQPVADRILVARNLHTNGRDALESGEVSLAQAMVIARAPGTDIQKSMLVDARHRSAKELGVILTRGQFLVAEARFDVDSSGLSVKRDLFDAFPAYFEDKAAALAAQVTHTEAVAERRRKTGKWAFVDVVISPYIDFHDRKYNGRDYSEKENGTGIILHIESHTGKFAEHQNIRLHAKAAAAQGVEQSPREMPNSAHQAAHELRATALRDAMTGDVHRTLALTVMTLIGQFSMDGGSLNFYMTDPMRAAMPEGLQIHRASLAVRLAQALELPEKTMHAVLDRAGQKVADANHADRLYAWLMNQSVEELLGLLNIVVLPGVYTAPYTSPDAPAPLFLRLANEVNAQQNLINTFTLTDEWLKRYPRHELVALAEEAGLGRALVEDAKTQKEMRARILEHAAKLHHEGFVPRLVRFPEGGKA